MNLFENLGLSDQLVATIKKLGFTEPTQIQKESIPYIVKGKDVIGKSATGSGKTLAFGCGIIERVIPKDGLQALILTPTRELAEQIKVSLNQLSANRKLSIISVYGGVSISTQIRDLTRADVVVATPGRLLDHLNRKTINTKKIKILVMDEADRMFDMGFIDDVEKIIKTCPPKRQTLFFSATISSKVNALANKHMVSPIKVSAENQVDPKKLKQVYYDVSRNMKMSLLVHLLQHEDSGRVMIFCNTRRSTDFVVKNLRANKLQAMGIHGGMTQSKRSKTIRLFSRADRCVLVCTDVAARGIHIDNVSHIYNYEIPKDTVDYVHRIGRTARAGETGEVINVLCDYDYDNFSKILSEYRDFIIKETEIPPVKKIQTIRAENAGKSQRRRPPMRGYRRKR